MTVGQFPGRPTTAVVIGVASVLLASCGQATASAAKSPAPVAVTSPPPVAPTAPVGGPVPAQLLGVWFLGGGDAAPIAFNPPATGGPPCPMPYSSVSCYFQLSLTATSYHFYIGPQRLVTSGSVVANASEIDLFNGATCDGVGRYTWAVTGSALLFTLISDPCGRSDILTYQSWSRSH